MVKKRKNNLIIYQTKNGAIELKGDFNIETMWASQKQIADIFGVDRSVITRHIKNIFKDKELNKKVVCAKFAHTTLHGAIKGKTQTRELGFYNLDIILAVGYRTKSSIAISFRKWATKILKQHIVHGYTINKKQVVKNYDKFLQAVESVKKLLPKNSNLKISDALELVNLFANTWFSLGAYDKTDLPKKGLSKKQVKITAEELSSALDQLKQDLLQKKETTDFFGRQKDKTGLDSIIANVFQSFAKKDLYQTVEEKAAHLLYFIIKNHLFVDGNKRSAAFAFIWFLNSAKIDFRNKISPEALTALTLLIAESNPKDKERMIGLVILFLTNKK